jgi:hypothetical protein
MRVAACRPIGISKDSLNTKRVFFISSYSQFAHVYWRKSWLTNSFNHVSTPATPVPRLVTTARYPACRSRTPKRWRVVSLLIWIAPRFAAWLPAICHGAANWPTLYARYAPKSVKPVATSARSIKWRTARNVPRLVAAVQTNADVWLG